MLGIVSSILIASGTLIGSGALLQRSNMSIEINIVRSCTPAACYV